MAQLAERSLSDTRGLLPVSSHKQKFIQILKNTTDCLQNVGSFKIHLLTLIFDNWSECDLH